MKYEARRLSAAVPTSISRILAQEPMLWRQARGQENLHHARKWARKAAQVLWKAGKRAEAIRFVWARERAIIGLTAWPDQGPLDQAEREARDSALEIYGEMSVADFEALMIHYSELSIPPRKWMFETRRTA